MLLAITAALTPFLINGATELTKYLTNASTTEGKRFILALVSIVGVISLSALNGLPLDNTTVAGLVETAFGALAAFLAAHGSYTLITGKTAQVEVPNE